MGIKGSIINIKANMLIPNFTSLHGNNTVTRAS